MEHLLKAQGAHSKVITPQTDNLTAETHQADILITAAGACDFIRGPMIKSGAIIIDIGINRDEDDNLCGDVNFHEAEEVAGFITPVPGGVGPVTVAMLLYNTLKLAEQHTH